MFLTLRVLNTQEGEGNGILYFNPENPHELVNSGANETILKFSSTWVRIKCAEENLKKMIADAIALG